ncbi:MAG: IS1 family transposase, partial [Candidatus Competibacter sp.]
MICPRCHSLNVVKNGSIHNHKPKFACKDCGRQFVENPENKIP